MELTVRVLALLVLLYAQPLARIQQLTVDDIATGDDGQLLIRLGDPPTPVPAPFDQVIRQHVAARRNQMTAANTTSPWLFPGRASGQPMHTTSLRLRLHNLGIPNLTNRSRAIREMLRQAPAIIVAGMLGYTTVAEKIAAEYGGTWQNRDRVRLRRARLMWEGRIVHAMRHPVTVTAPEGHPPQVVAIAAGTIDVGGAKVPTLDTLMRHPYMIATETGAAPDAGSEAKTYRMQPPDGEQFLAWAPGRVQVSGDAELAVTTSWDLIGIDEATFRY